MRRHVMFGGLTVAALVAVGSCSDDVGPTTNERFVATLSGANESPAVTTTATGTAEFTVFNELPGIFFKLDVKGPFADSVILAHIHGPADPAVNAAVIVNLFLGPNAGPAINGTLGRHAADSQPDHVRFGAGAAAGRQGVRERAHQSER